MNTKLYKPLLIKAKKHNYEIKISFTQPDFG